MGWHFSRFSHAQNIRAWEKVGAVPLSRKCLSSPKIRCLIVDGNDDQQALVHLIIEHSIIACKVLLLEGYNGDMMTIMLKPIKQTHAITTPHTHNWIELLSQAKTHSSVFAATGSVHPMANNIFQGISLEQCKMRSIKTLPWIFSRGRGRI